MTTKMKDTHGGHVLAERLFVPAVTMPGIVNVDDAFIEKVLRVGGMLREMGDVEGAFSSETIGVNIVNDFMVQQCLSACRIIPSMVMVMEMVIKIDKQGRLLLPKDIREKYHMVHDTDLVVTEESDGIKLSVKKEKKRLKDVFDNAPSFDPKKALVIDVANFDEDET